MSYPTASNSWRAGARALFEMMTPKGQQEALKAWAAISERAGGPFTPALPTSPIMAVQPERVNGLLDNFTVLDLEFQGNDLLELAAIRYEHWEPVAQLQSFVRFRGDINTFVYNVTGITKDLTWNAPEEKTVLQRFKQLAGDSVLVAHNVVTADKRVLEAARTRQGAKAPLTNRWLCTWALAKLRLPKTQKCGLSDLCELFSIDNKGHHQALRDVQMCYQVLRHLHAQQPITELVTSTAKPKNLGQVALFPVAA